MKFSKSTGYIISTENAKYHSAKMSFKEHFNLSYKQFKSERFPPELFSENFLQSTIEEVSGKVLIIELSDSESSCDGDNRSMNGDK